MSQEAACKLALWKFKEKNPMITFILQNIICTWVCGWYLLHISSDVNSLVVCVALNSWNSYSLKRSIHNEKYFPHYIY